MDSRESKARPGGSGQHLANFLDSLEVAFEARWLRAHKAHTHKTECTEGSKTFRVLSLWRLAV